ncbi:MAG: hypothetical protein Q9196_005324 [Gyalolechia fulgens]
MSQTASRKRPAPGASPIVQQSQPPVDRPLAAQMAFPQNLQWDTANQASTASSAYPTPPNNFSHFPQSPTQQQQPSSNQLTRRPPAQDLAQPQNAPYPNGNSETWPSFSENGTQQLSEPIWGSNVDELDQKAVLAKMDAQAKRKQIPPFVQKLSSFLDESRNTELIRWSTNGDSFIVIDEDEFARTLIPELFKHKNYASFVRQLNMYGFHKKVGLSDNSMRASEKKNKSPSEYYNPYFKRGRPNLLWLIQKPKNTPSRGGGRGGRGRQEESNVDDDLEDIYDVDQAIHPHQASADASNIRHGRQPLMIGNGGLDNTPQDLGAVHEELQAVRKQQQMIATLLQKTRAEHEQLYGQAASFQKLHDRHESSINAILTFLATVYNRNLEGKGGPNFGGMFGSISQDTQGQGNVVDVGDYSDPNMMNGQTQGGFRKQQLLLGAPPGEHRRGSIASPGVSAESPAPDRLYPGRTAGGPSSPIAREVFDTPSDRSSQSPQAKADAGNHGQPSEVDILSMIQSSNAKQPYGNGSQMNFPEALSHLQTADGQRPLTANQRNDALRLIASTTGNCSAKGENALTSPSPPMPNMAQYVQSKERLDELSNALKEQGSKVNQLSSVLAPLSPVGSIPGITDGPTYGDGGTNDLLDLDQIFNSGDYFNDNDFNFGLSEPLPDFNFEPNDGHCGQTDAPPRFGFDGTVDEGPEGSGVETVNSSEGTSPATTAEDHNGGQQEGRNTGKRRRKGHTVVTVDGGNDIRE